MLPIQTPNFAHLHVHSGFSFYQSTIKISELVTHAEKLQIPAIAVVDDGNMAGAVECYFKGKQKGINGIVGATVTVNKLSASSETSKLVLLCENLMGYRNLCRLTSARIITKSTLTKHSTGLIALSAGLYGELNKLCRQGRDKEAPQVALWLASIFPERFFIELHPVTTPGQKDINGMLRQLAAKVSVPTVATAPCHYLRKDDRPALDVLRKLGKLPPLSETDGEVFWLMSAEEMAVAFADDPASVAMSVAIADLCQLKLNDRPFILPPYISASGKNADEELRDLAYKRLERKNFSDGRCKNYRNRLDEELAFLRQKGLAPWLLFVADVVALAKQANIMVGPGAGLGPSSLVAHYLGIYELDPLEHGLICGSLRRKELRSFPYYAINVPRKRLRELLHLVARRYGYDRVAIPTYYNHLDGSRLIKQLGVVLGVDRQKPAQFERFWARSCYRYALDLFSQEFQQSDQVTAELKTDESIKQLFRYFQILIDLPTKATLLGGELLVTPNKLLDYIPYCRTGRLSRSHFIYGTHENIGLATLRIEDLRELDTLDRLSRRYDVDVRDIPFDDHDTWEFIGKGKAPAVFESHPAGMQRLRRQIKPSCLHELAAAGALYRPGPFESGMVDDYIRAKNEGIKPHWYPEQLETILGETYGVIVFREQIVNVCCVAGYSYVEADSLWQALVRDTDRERARFLEKASSNGFSEQEAECVYNKMALFAPYAFMKSHALVRAVIIYRLAYFKAHYPENAKNAVTY